MPFEAPVRVRYEETDRMGVVYHSNYIVYFEVGRTEFLRAMGCRYRELEEQGFVLAVTECAAKFHRSAHYDDLLSVRVWVEELGKSTLRLGYEIWRESELLVTGHTAHAMLGKVTMRPIRIAEAMRVALERGMAEHPRQ